MTPVLFIKSQFFEKERQSHKIRMTRQAELFEKEKLEGPDNTYIKPPLIQAWAEKERGNPCSI